MAHMVIYRGADGKPGYHQTDDIVDAVSFVEEIRNRDGVEHARIFRLEEVVFEYQPYFKVQLASGASDIHPEVDIIDSANGVEVPAEAAYNMEQLESAADAQHDAVNGSRRGLFGR